MSSTVLLEGDGGICAEKAMALYFIAHTYGIPCELILGGEEARGEFPYRALRRLLDDRTFEVKGTVHMQKFWQHFAVLCELDEEKDDFLLCDVANSNIPLILWDAQTAFPYLRDGHKTPLEVCITNTTLDLYYHRIPGHQDIPLDLYYAMEYFIDFIDLIQTIDGELGLILTEDFWLGVIAYAGEIERRRILQAYRRTLLEAHQDPMTDLHITENLNSSLHPLIGEFRDRYPEAFGKISAIDSYLHHRVDCANHPQQYQLAYALLRLPQPAGRRPPVHTTIAGQDS